MEPILSESGSETRSTEGKTGNDYLWTEKSELLVTLDTGFSSLSCSGKKTEVSCMTSTCSPSAQPEIARSAMSLITLYSAK